MFMLSVQYILNRAENNKNRESTTINSICGRLFTGPGP